MISQRRAAQVGLLAAAAVFVTSIGILVSSGSDTSQLSAPAHNDSAKQQNTPVTLSASVDSSTVVVAQH